MRILAVVGVIFAVSVSTANADTGLRMLHIRCDPSAGSILVQPFILWNGNTLHEGVALQNPQTQPEQLMGTSTFYSIGAGGGPVSQTCSTSGGRQVRILMQKKRLHVEDTRGVQTDVFDVDLTKDISSAWDVYGPLFRLQSTEPGVWQSCVAREDPDRPWVCRTLP